MHSFCEDCISKEIIKYCSPIVEHFIANAFKKFIKEKIYPKCSKTANIIPLDKN